MVVAIIIRLAFLILVCFTSSKSLLAQSSKSPSHLRFEIIFPEAQSAGKSLDGHILLGISTDKSSEPRYQLREEEASSAQFFGLDVDNWKPGQPAILDSTALGYPLNSLDQLPAGDYYVQAVLNIYETFHRADGHTVKLPPDQGEGQQWNNKPGNLLQQAAKDPHRSAERGVIRIQLTRKSRPDRAAKDTKYIKHIRIQSKLLSKFWGRPVYLGAIVLLPEGFDEHPNAHYPLLVHHGHFQHDFGLLPARTPPDSAT